jgi:uncharacterized protein YqjF (DUF2071 family)
MPGDFNHAIVNDVGHRPWPMPARPWVMTQTWHDLLFAHWPIDAAVLQAALPFGLVLDTFQSRAWIGIVPFRMTNVTARGWPNLPRVSAFPELNVRTYVRARGKPGVYFFSLDAASRLAVRAARLLFHLPYFEATMRISASDGAIAYLSRRRDSAGGRPAAFECRYAPAGKPARPVSGTLEHFLTERYCLHTADRRGRIVTVDIHHPPWPLQPARADFTLNTMAAAAGFQLPDVQPLLHFARRQDVVIWTAE